jgi:hypothetical protein
MITRQTVTVFGKDIVAPNILISGGPKHQMDLLLEATSALGIALEKVRGCTPHPRDYVSSDDFDVAHGEHLERIRALDTVHSELEALAVHIHDNMLNR